MAKQRQRQQGCAFTPPAEHAVGHRASAHLIYRRWIVCAARLDPGSRLGVGGRCGRHKKITLDEAKKRRSAYL
jgi:hypothetical protein